MKRLKAISPLVAAVLLIAVTMTIAGVLAYWASGFVKSQTALFENQTVATECNLADFVVHRCSYNNNTATLNLVLNNLRSIDLRQIVAQVVYPNETIRNEPFNETLVGGRLQSYKISNVDNTYKEIVIRTHCPNILISTKC